MDLLTSAGALILVALLGWLGLRIVWQFAGGVLLRFGRLATALEASPQSN